MSLCVTGRDVELGDGANEVMPHLRGITRIDLENGKIAAEALEGSDIEQLWIAPDGSAIYAFGSDEPWELATGAIDHYLRRLDPESLDVEAERALPSTSWVIAVPMSPGGVN